MSFIKGLKAINNVLEEQRQRAEKSADYQKVEWLKLTDGQAVKARFVEELDEDSPGYDESRGLAVVIAEHTAPEDFRRKAVCTKDDDGRCYACEQAQSNPKAGWWPKLRYYTNVIIDDGKDAPHVVAWSQGVSNKSAFNILREQAIDMGSVSNLQWKLKRNGLGTETSYLLMPQLADAEPFDWSAFEFFDLEKIVREVPYAEQEAFYLGLDANVAAKADASIDW
jgi:hypothetical protein